MRQERIKDRVLKRAARSWGFSGTEMETKLDISLYESKI